MNNSTVQKIIKEIESYTPRTSVKQSGVVTAVGDGVVLIDGLPGAVLGENFLFY